MKTNLKEILLMENAHSFLLYSDCGNFSFLTNFLLLRFSTLWMMIFPTRHEINFAQLSPTTGGTSCSRLTCSSLLISCWYLSEFTSSSISIFQLWQFRGVEDFRVNTILLITRMALSIPCGMHNILIIIPTIIDVKFNFWKSVAGNENFRNLLQSVRSQDFFFKIT